MATDIINFCESKEGMSVCVKKEEYKEQEKCSYYEKASNFNRCMFLIFNEYCDCLDAQMKIKETEKK